jgi:Nitroreductase family
MKGRLVFSLKTKGVSRLDDLTKFGKLSLRALSSTSHTPDAATVFDSVVTSRSFAKSFQKDKHVDPALIEKLLRLSQLAPSSFNLQPYKMILVQQQAMKEALADTMLGGNAQRVLEAPLTIVYLSDRGEYCIFYD